MKGDMCPLTKEECRLVDCAWFLDDVDACSIAVLGSAVWYIQEEQVRQRR